MQNGCIGYQQKAIESINMFYYINWDWNLLRGYLKPISMKKIEKS